MIFPNTGWLLTIIGALTGIYLFYRRKKEKKIEEIKKKIESENRPLRVADLKYILSQDLDKLSRRFNSNQNKWDFCKKTDSKITENLGHSCFRSVLEDMEEKLSGDLREDLLDPAREPEGFEKFEEDKSEEGKEEGIKTWYRSKITDNAFRVAPEKKPASLTSLRTAVMDYIVCEGKGFLVSNEIETAYKEYYEDLYRAAGKTFNYLEGYKADIEMNREDNNFEVQVTYSSETAEFKKTFTQEDKWIDTQAFEPLQKAIKRESSKVLYRTGDKFIALEKSDYSFLEKTFTFENLSKLPANN